MWDGLRSQPRFVALLKRLAWRNETAPNKV
jgi:hypothetical protein